jgi:hypothetical protein
VRPERRGGVLPHLRPSADERCEMAGSEDGIGVVGMEEAGTDRLVRATRLSPA